MIEIIVDRLDDQDRHVIAIVIVKVVVIAVEVIEVDLEVENDQVDRVEEDRDHVNVIWIGKNAGKGRNVAYHLLKRDIYLVRQLFLHHTKVLFKLSRCTESVKANCATLIENLKY